MSPSLRSSRTHTKHRPCAIHSLCLLSAVACAQLTPLFTAILFPIPALWSRDLLLTLFASTNPQIIKQIPCNPTPTLPKKNPHAFSSSPGHPEAENPLPRGSSGPPGRCCSWPRGWRLRLQVGPPPWHGHGTPHSAAVRSLRGRRGVESSRLLSPGRGSRKSVQTD